MENFDEHFNSHPLTINSPKIYSSLRTQSQSYVDSLNIVNKYPGINGMGVIYNVTADKLAGFINQQRQSQPSFTIHPAHQQQQFLPITYIIPVAGNEQAVGLDMAFEKNRYSAVRQAATSGNAQLTGPIVLVQDQAKTPGFLLFTPFYAKQRLINDKQREAQFEGVVYAPFIMKNFMSGTLAKNNRDIAIKLSDNQSVLYNEQATNSQQHFTNARYKKKVDVALYSRTWTFDLWSTTAFVNATANNQPYAILFGGILIDSLLLVLFVQMAGAKQRAVSYANALNKDIKRQANIHSTLNKRLELALSASAVGVWEYDIETEALIWDDAMFGLYGVSNEHFAGAYEIWELALHGEDKPQVLASLQMAIANACKFDTAFRIVHPDKKIRVIRALADVVLEEGVVKKMVGVNWDVTDIKDKEAQLARLARYDTLSQLKNRFSFNEACTALIKRASKTDKQFALLLIDVDDFKQINDLYGHQAGDKFISLLAGKLSSACRGRDTVFRLGGDEFAILSDFINDSDIAGDIAERIILSLHQPFDIDGDLLHSSCSIGIAIFPYAGNNVDELMTNADIALYKSKKEGKDCIHFFNDSLNVKAKRVRYIKNNLMNAARHGEIFMNYQPIVDALSNKAIAFEALARWDSSIGLIPPDEFIAVAEKSNQINRLGSVIIQTVANDIANMPQPLRVTINCSSKQLVANSGFSDMLLTILKEATIQPSQVILEITETYIIRDYKAICKTLEKIHQHGVDIAIDDFGTGYSSLSLLANIPCQYLKIDKEFVNNMHTPTGFKVLSCIYNVAKSLDKQIIAEGVETKEQVTTLVNMGIHLIQGYYFSKPVDIEQIASTTR